MTTITTTLTSICAGGDHLTFAISGAKVMTIKSNATDMASALTNEEAEAFVKALVKLAKVGRTNAQVKTLFQTGVSVTI